jgi:hypothetical protein
VTRTPAGRLLALAIVAGLAVAACGGGATSTPATQAPASEAPDVSLRAAADAAARTCGHYGAFGHGSQYDPASSGEAAAAAS